MDLKVNEYIYIIESIGEEVYIKEGIVEKITSTSLYLSTKQPTNSNGIKFITKEYYPKQKNIIIEKSKNNAQLIYLAIKLRGRDKCDKLCYTYIQVYIQIESELDLRKKIEISKSQFPELWL